MIAWPVRASMRRGRLVADQQAGLMNHGTGNGHALLLPAGQLRGQRIHSVAEPHGFSISMARATAGRFDEPLMTNGTATFSAAVKAGSRLNC